MSDSPVVYVLDDDSAVRESIEWLLSAEGLTPKLFADAPSLLAALGADTPGCVVADLRLPGMSGLEVLDAMKDRGLLQPVLFITGHGEVGAAVQAMRNGAIDFLEKPFSDELLLSRVREALRLDQAQRDDRARRARVIARLARLTPREREVMHHVVRGRLNKQIAADLGLSHKTVEVHRAHVMEKTTARSLAELVRMAVLVEPKPEPAALAN
ncbi:MAG: response regulator [Planctomycetota bacterium]